MGQWAIRTLQWAVGAFLLALGTLMAVAPHTFTGRLLLTLGEGLSAWGALFLASGAGLLAVAALAPRDWRQWAAHLLACGPLVLLLTIAAQASGWLSIVNYSVLTLATGLAPVLNARSPASWLGRRDLLVVALGSATALDGVLLLFGYPLPSAAALGVPAAIGLLVGLGLLIGGAIVVVAQLRAIPTRLAWAGYLLASAGLLSIGVLSGLNRSLPGALYYGGFGLTMAMLPWLGTRQRRPDPASLRTQLAVALAALAALPLLVGVTLLAGREEEATLDRSLARKEALATSMATYIESHISLHQAGLATLAARPGLLALPAADQQRILASVQAAYPDLDELLSGAADGRQLARSDGRPLASSVGAPAFNEVRRTNAPAVDVRPLPTSPATPHITIGQPIRDAQGRFGGYLIGALNTLDVADHFRQAISDVGRQVTLVDGAGRVILTTAAQGPAFGADLSASPPVAALDSGRAGALRYGTGSELLAGYAPVPGLGWGVIVETPTDALLANARAGRELAAGLLLITLLGTAAVGWRLAGRLTAPLAGLVQASDHLAAGDAAAPLPVATGEVGQLVAAFGTMRDRVTLALTDERQARENAEHNRQRAALLAETSRLFAEAGPDAPAVLDTLAHRLTETAADVGIVLLLGEADRLDVVAWHARDPEAVAIVAAQMAVAPLQHAAGLAGRVVATGEPVVVSDIAPDALPAIFRPEDRDTLAHLDLRAALGVPLRAHGRVLGVLILARFGLGRPFGPDDLALAQDLADRAGLVVEAARLAAVEQQTRTRLAFLAETGRALGGSLEPAQTAATIARLAVPTLGDYSIVHLTDDHGFFYRAAVAHVDPAQEALLQSLRSTPFDLRRPNSQVARALAAGRPVALSEIDDAWLAGIAADDEHLRVLRALAPRCLITAPLVARGRPIGALTIAGTAASGRRFDDHDLVLIGELGERAAIAIDNARLYAAEQATRSQAVDLGERLRLAQAAGQIGAFEWDMVAQTVTWSPEMEALHGLPIGSFGGTYAAWQAVVHPDDRQRVEAEAGAQMAASHESEVRFRIVRPDGSIRHILARSQHIENDGRDRVVGVNIDITDRQRAETQLRQLALASLAINAAAPAEARLTTIADQARVIIGAHRAAITIVRDGDWATAVTVGSVSERDAARWPSARPVRAGDLEREVIESNRPCRLTQAELEAHRLGPAIAPADDTRPSLRGWLAAPLVGRDGANLGLLQLTDRDDGDFTAEDEAILVQVAQLAAGAIERGELLDAEQIARARAEHAAERIARLQAVTAALAEAATTEAIADVVVTQGLPALGARGGGITRLSADGMSLEVLGVVGYPPDVAAAWQRYPLDKASPPADAVRDREPVWIDSPALLRERYPEVGAGAMMSGDRAWGLLPLIANGRVLGILTVGWAAEGVVTPADRVFAMALARLCGQALERARLLEAERAARADAEAAVQARDAFLSIAAHELKTPTTGIKGAAQLMARRSARGELDEARLTRTLGSLVEAADRLARLTDDLLDVARLRTGQLALDAQLLDLGPLVAAAVERCQEQLEEGHRLRLDLPEQPLPVQADADRLDQVLDNLLDNAVKYSPDGGEVRVSVRPEGQGIVMRVRDHGMGLPDGAAESIFAPFGRATNAEASHLPGMGLGLYICRGIVERHDGRIWAESDGEGQGTTVTVWLRSANEETMDG